MSSELTPLRIAFPGVSVHTSADLVLLRAERPLRCIASTVTGGGIGNARAMLSLRVERNFDCGNPPALLRRAAAEVGLAGRFIGFLTALDLGRAGVLESGDPRVLVLATAGTSNAATPGRTPVAGMGAGTINIAVVLDARLTPAALVAAVKVITEAKTLALYEAGVKTAQGEIATGTSTDAVAVGCTGRGAYHRYAGPVTPIGATLGRLVTEAVRISLAGGNVEALRT